MALRISAKEKAELSRLNRNARAKLRRIEKKYGVKEDIPIIKPADFTSRKDVTAYKKQLRRFTSRDNPRYQYYKTDEGAVSKETYREAERIVKRENQKRAREMKKLARKTTSVMGEPQPGYDVAMRAEMQFQQRGTVMEQFKPIKLNINTFRSEAQLKKYIEKIESRLAERPMKNEQYKENYKKALQAEFGKMADDMIAEIDKMPTDTFIREVAVSDEYGEIAAVYSLEDSVKYQGRLLDFFRSVNSKGA